MLQSVYSNDALFYLSSQPGDIYIFLLYRYKNEEYLFKTPFYISKSL